MRGGSGSVRYHHRPRLFAPRIALRRAGSWLWRAGSMVMRIPARGRLGFSTKVALFVCLFVLSGLASAAPRNKKGASPVTVDVPALTEKLKSSDPAEIQA